MAGLKDIKLIVLDVDGVLTDGSLLIGSDGIEYKAFNTLDGMGISLARHLNINVAIITGRKSNAVLIRAKELNIDYVFLGIDDKQEVLKKLMDDLNLEPENVCYMGDDINDLSVISLVGVFFAPSNAVEYVKQKADYITCKKGGQGAVREMIDKIIHEKANYTDVIESYLNRGKIKQ